VRSQTRTVRTRTLVARHRGRAPAVTASDAGRVRSLLVFSHIPCGGQNGRINYEASFGAEKTARGREHIDGAEPNALGSRNIDYRRTPMGKIGRWRSALTSGSSRLRARGSVRPGSATARGHQNTPSPLSSARCGSALMSLRVQPDLGRMTGAAIVLGLAIPALLDAFTRIGCAMHIDSHNK
jgi:hypothetical protein